MPPAGSDDMMQLPFSNEEFFAVFVSYNTAVWPAQLLLVAAAVTAVWLAIRHRHTAARGVWGILAGLWIWTGVAYHLLHFTAINPAAWAFGALFVVQGVLFLWRGVVRGPPPFETVAGIRGALALLVLLYALVIYPLLSAVAGHPWLTSPTFGAPCPVVIFTFGMLLLAPRAPAWLYVIPTLWAILGISAVVSFGIVQDAGLPVSAVIALTTLLRRRATAPQVSRA
jgi:hypothetical protein